jgi:hypothetical protein
MAAGSPIEGRTPMPVAARFRRVTPVALALTLALGAFVATQAQSPSDAVRAAFTKYEYMVPMRDGVKLFTSVYVPKDASTTYPILLTRTPYSVAPYGVANYRDSLGPTPTGYLGRWPHFFLRARHDDV